VSPADQQPPSTATLESARDHARSLADGEAAGVTIPATSATDLPGGVSATDVIWDEVVPAGGYAVRRIPRETMLRLCDIDGDACVALVLHRADHPVERLNVADTVKVQWQAYLGAGSVLLSDMGRVLATIVEDTGGRHDALCGCSSPTDGTGAWTDTPNGRDLLCLGLAKHGLARRDLPPNVNLFVEVRVDEDGGLQHRPAVAPGAHVTLRAEMDLLVTLADVAHPLDDRTGPHVTPVRVTAWRPGTPASDDGARESTPERRRAFENNDELLAGGAR
jgi:urea carboxylase-associated protein 2